MKDAELIRALKRMSIETGGIICLGCGQEHSCRVHGCAILKEAAKRILKAAGQPEKKAESEWILPERELPPDGEEVLVLMESKKGIRNIDKGYWAIDHFIHRGTARVIGWMALPALYPDGEKDDFFEEEDKK